jgi:dipeptide/tripeptide permease
LAGSSVSLLVLFFAFGFVTVAAIFLLALALVIANATFFLTAVLFVIAIFLPVVAPIFASVVSHEQVCVVERSCAIVGNIVCQNGAI